MYSCKSERVAELMKCHSLQHIPVECKGVADNYLFS
jgi:hypothetical protein